MHVIKSLCSHVKKKNPLGNNILRLPFYLKLKQAMGAPGTIFRMYHIQIYISVVYIFYYKNKQIVFDYLVKNIGSSF